MLGAAAVAGSSSLSWDWGYSEFPESCTAIRAHRGIWPLLPYNSISLADMLTALHRTYFIFHLLFINIIKTAGLTLLSRYITI